MAWCERTSMPNALACWSCVSMKCWTHALLLFMNLASSSTPCVNAPSHVGWANTGQSWFAKNACNMYAWSRGGLPCWAGCVACRLPCLFASISCAAREPRLDTSHLCTCTKGQHIWCKRQAQSQLNQISWIQQIHSAGHGSPGAIAAPKKSLLHQS